MAGVLQHLRSSALNKRPNPASMVDGQVAINYASGSPGMFFKDSNGSLVKVGPVHVGSGAPNVVPASGGTAGNSIGEQWLDTSGGTYVFKIWDGAAWRSEAGEFVNATGDTMTGDLVMNNANVVFEGSVDDGFETTLTVVNPTADRTITLPNVTGTVVTTGDSGTVTSTMIADGTIIDGDVNASAAIAGTKISPDFGSQTIQTTGIVSHALGSASAPTVTFTGDTNTGIYSPGADQVAISTNGTGRLFVDSSGNVGVGTTGPSRRLHVNTGADTDNVILATSAALNSYICFADLTTTDQTGLSVRLGSSGNNLIFNTGGTTERMRLDSSGRLGLGTSSPATGLHIANTPGSATTGNVYVSNAGQARYKLYNGGAVCEWLFGQKTISDHSFTVSKLVGSTESDYLSITSAGNVGIGTTSPAYALDVVNTIAGVSFANSMNWNYPGLTLRRNASNVSTAKMLSMMLNGDSESDTVLTNYLNIWGTYSGTPTTGSTTSGLNGVMNFGAPNALAFHTNTSECVRIDSSGRLLVGTSSARANLFNSTIAPAIQLEGAGIVPAQRFLSVINNYATAGDGGGVIALGRSKGGIVGSNTVVASGDQLGGFDFLGNDGTEFVTGATIEGYVDGTPGANDMPGRLVFSTTADGASSPTERMRILSNGTHQTFNSTGTSHEIRTALGAGTSDNFILGAYGASNVTGGGTASFVVRTNGNVENTNNSYTGISDIKLKENIVDANSQWDDLKALQVRNYNFKEGQTHTQIGLVAQEVELVSPGLVSESPDRDADGNDLGTVTKSVNYSVLYMKAVKALQEAMERIETLEQRLNDAGIA